MTMRVKVPAKSVQVEGSTRLKQLPLAAVSTQVEIVTRCCGWLRVHSARWVSVKHILERVRERERGTCQLRVLDTQLLNQVLQRLPAAHLHLLGLKGQIVHQHLVLCAERLVCRWSASPTQGVTPESLGAVGTLHALTEVGSPQGLVVIRRSERNWQLLDAPPSPACGHNTGQAWH